MTELFISLGLGFEIYINFFLVFFLPLLMIFSLSFPLGLIIGFFYNLHFKR